MDTNFIKTRIEPVMRDVLAAALNVPTLRERVIRHERGARVRCKRQMEQHR
jgi:hypothetical protein